MCLTSENTSKEPAAIIPMSDPTGHPRRAHGTLTFDIRGDIIPCWLNINIYQPLKNRKRSIVCTGLHHVKGDYQRWQSGLGLVGTGTSVPQPYGSIFFLPFGFNKSVCYHIDWFSIFYKAEPRMWPASDSFKQTTQAGYTVYMSSLLLYAELNVTEQILHGSKDFVTLECCSGRSSSCWRATQGSFEL